MLLYFIDIVWPQWVLVPRHFHVSVKMGKRSYASKSATSEISRFSDLLLVITFWSSRYVCKTRPISRNNFWTYRMGYDHNQCGLKMRHYMPPAPGVGGCREDSEKIARLCIA